MHINGIAAGDTLVVNIDHESNSFRKSFKFRERDVIRKKSLGFKVYDDGKRILINRISTQPVNG
jgi:hypothetical protein